ncbi:MULTISPECIES: helix-turn-helix domain-containing protein [unclassified Streptomyces]|uniref:helix-turn-helix domain-containing protein n=1 Tax=unclassified Streptomyces TaxID=2593676 RepID=UPI003B63B82D
MEHRYRAVLEVLDGAPVVEVALRCGVSLQSVHTWRKRYQEGGVECLVKRSRRPHRAVQATRGCRGIALRTPAAASAVGCSSGGFRTGPSQGRVLTVLRDGARVLPQEKNGTVSRCT